MRRRDQFSLPTGFAVISIPESGLFYKDGRMVSGDGLELTCEEIILFKRRTDAEAHSTYLRGAWDDGSQKIERREYVIMGVLVKERQ